MSDFIQSTPDRPLNWTLESEKPLAKLNLSELWALWRTRTAQAEAYAAKHGLYERGQSVGINETQVNAYHEQELLKHEL